MDVRPVLDPGEAPLALSASFNNPLSAFSVGTENGFCVLSAESSTLQTSRNLEAGIGICEMLGKYNYLALVGGGKNPRWPQTKMVLWDDAKQKVTVTLEHKTVVLRVRLTRTHIVVALQNSIHLYTFSSKVEKLAVYETTNNHLGLCCLDANIVIFPGRSPGKVQLVELATKNVSIIPAHTGALRALDLSKDGQLLATASEKGTLVRLFSTINCAKLAELRRGVDPAFVFSIAISPDSSMLAVTSDKSTLHIFDLTQVTGISSTTTQNRPSQSSQHSHSVQTADDDPIPNKWGLLSRLPLLPRIFADAYSFTSAQFDMGDEPSKPGSSPSYLPALGSMPSRPLKGILGWLDEGTVLCIGTGRDAKWERFRVGVRSYIGKGGLEEYRKEVWRDGWRRYLGS